MNNFVMLLGRTTKDIEVKVTPSGTQVATFSLAVDRQAKEKETDFITCVAFNKTAEILNQYVPKGSKIQVAGRLQTGSYTKSNGEKVFTTDVIVSSIEFCESKKAQPSAPSPYGENRVELIDMPPEDDLPFD